MQDWLQQYVDRRWLEFSSYPAGGLVYLVATVFTFLFIVSGFSLEFSGQFFLLLAALIAIARFRIWLVPIILLLYQVDLLLSEEMTELQIEHGLGQFLTAGIVLAFVISTSRYVVLCGTAVPYHARTLFGKITSFVANFVPKLFAAVPVGVSSRDTRTFSPREVFMAVATILSAVAVAAAILSSVELDFSVRANVGLTTAAVRTIRLGITIVVSIVFGYYLIEMVCWNFLTRQEAKMFLRNECTNEFRADLQRIVQQEKKEKHTQNRKR